MPIRVASTDFGLLRFNTAQLPVRERLDVWRDVVNRELLPLSIDPARDRPFRASVAMRAWGGVRIGSGIVGASVNHRTRDIVAADNDDMTLLINAGGPLSVQSPGREFVLEPGSATLLSCDQLGKLSRPEAGKTVCVRFPRADMADLVPAFERAIGCIVPGTIGVMPLLKHYLDALCEPEVSALPPGAGPLIVQHVCDMIALTIGAAGDAAALAGERGLAAGRLAAAKSFIDGRITAGPISIEHVAAHLQLAPRAVRKLFEGDGGVSGYVTRRRLITARSMLESPRFAATSIAAIAFDVGFGDLSYFNRLFRDRYHATPSDVRALAGQNWRARLDHVGAPG